MTRFLIALILFLSPPAALAKAVMCDQAAATAARESGVPVEVLRALTRTETGRRMDGALRPWPWTVNMEGEGRWFDNRAEAMAFVERRRSRGARSFDIGCFQINHMWRGQHFASIEAMSDPLTNARYAARFLNEIRAERVGPRPDWVRIAGAYHSRTPKYAKKYKARFKRIMANLPDPGSMPLAPAEQTEPLVQTAAVARENNFPLLQRGSSAGAMGSLFPGSTGSARPFLGNGG